MYIVRQGRSYEVSYVLRNVDGSLVCSNCSSLLKDVSDVTLYCKCPFCQILLISPALADS